MAAEAPERDAGLRGPDWEAASGWAGQDAMSDFEALMWRSERHPHLSSTIGALELLDRVPDWDRLRSAYARGTAIVPKFRQRVVEPVLPIGPPRWAFDERFDLDYHLRRVRVAEPGDRATLLDLVEQLVMQPMDRTRPLWEAWIIEGLEGDRAAHVLKVHHSWTDGIGAVQLLSKVHSGRRAPSGAPDVPEPETPAPPNPFALTVRDAAGLALRAPGWALRATPGVVAGAAAPHRALGRALGFGASARRVLNPPVPERSTLLARRKGTRWRFITLECELDALKRAGKSAGGSVNDAFLAVLLGGLARYHRRHDAPLGTLPISMPISVRAAGDAEGGNKWAAVVVPGPASVEDPAERIALLRGVVLAVRAEPAVGIAGAMSPVLSRLPGGVSALLAHKAASGADLAASNVPGIRHDVYMAGAKVDRIFACMPLPGVAVMSAMNSHGKVCCIGVTADGDAIPDTEVFEACLQEELAAVLELAGG